MTRAIERCVGDPERFVREHWARAPLYWPGRDPEAFADLLTLGDVDRVLGAGLRLPAFRLVKDGKPLDVSSYTKSGRIGSQPLDDLADPGRVYEHFHAGATIVLQGLHRYWPPLARLCRDLELFLSHPTQANAYLTPPSSRGLGLHHDTHDVFVLQVHGRKLWEVHPPAVAFPPPGGPAPAPAATAGVGEPLVSAELRAGDCLYVPRGFPHAARTATAASAHLTIGVLTTTWNDVLRHAMARMAGEPSFREALPVGFADDPAALRDALAERLRELRGWLDKLDLDQLAEEVVARVWRNRPPLLDGQLEQLLALDRIDDRTTVRRRPGGVCRLARRGDELEVQLGDRELRMPARLEPAMRAVLDRGRFAVGDLAGHLDEESRRTLVRRLVREGLLEAVTIGGATGRHSRGSR